MPEPSATLSCPSPLDVNRQPPAHAALMGIYEANYQCLLALCPPLRNPALQARRYMSDVLPGMPALELAVHDHSRHTSTFGLACRWNTRVADEGLPDVQVRLYRDSGQAELLGYSGTLQFLGGAPEGSLQREWLQRRYSGNHSLFNWLRYCLRQGYHFSVDSGQDP